MTWQRQQGLLFDRPRFFVTFFYVCIRQKVILERPTQSSIRCGNINSMTLSVFVSRS